MHMCFKDSVTVTAETTLSAAVALGSVVYSFTMLFKGNFRAEGVTTLAACMAQFTGVAAESVAADVSWIVAFVITQRAKVGGLLVMNSLAMQPQLGRGPKSLMTQITSMPA